MWLEWRPDWVGRGLAGRAVRQHAPDGGVKLQVKLVESNDPLPQLCRNLIDAGARQGDICSLEPLRSRDNDKCAQIVGEARQILVNSDYIVTPECGQRVGNTAIIVLFSGSEDATEMMRVQVLYGAFQLRSQYRSI